MIISIQSIGKMQNYATWIQIVLSFILKLKMFTKILQKRLQRFDTSYRPLLTGKNKNVIGSMKDELGGKIMIEFVSVRTITFSYFVDDNNCDKKAKGTKKCVIKRILKFNNYKKCLLNNEIILKSQQRFKSEPHNVYTEEINKNTLSRAMMIRDCKLLMELLHIHMVQVLEMYAKQSC